MFSFILIIIIVQIILSQTIGHVNKFNAKHLFHHQSLVDIIKSITTTTVTTTKSTVRKQEGSIIIIIIIP